MEKEKERKVSDPDVEKIMDVFDSRLFNKLMEIASRQQTEFSEWERGFILNNLRKWRDTNGRPRYSDRVIRIVNGIHRKIFKPEKTEADKERERKYAKRYRKKKHSNRRITDRGQKKVAACCMSCYLDSYVSFREIHDRAARVKCNSCGGNLAITKELTKEQRDKFDAVRKNKR